MVTVPEMLPGSGDRAAASAIVTGELVSVLSAITIDPRAASAALSNHSVS